jgi:hypothetical protein
MPLNLERTRRLLQSFDFKTLFIEELGWENMCMWGKGAVLGWGGTS